MDYEKSKTLPGSEGKSEKHACEHQGQSGTRVRRLPLAPGEPTWSKCGTGAVKKRMLERCPEGTVAYTRAENEQEEQERENIQPPCAGMGSRLRNRRVKLSLGKRQRGEGVGIVIISPSF